MRTCLVLLLLTAITSPSNGADNPAIQPHRLTLSPTRLPYPPRRFRLLPELIDQQSGNAAKFYQEAAVLIKEKLGDGFNVDAGQMLDKPLAEFPADQARTLVKIAEPVLDLIERGTRCESCNWGTADEIRTRGVGFRLPGIHEMRIAGVALQLKLRLHLLDEQPERAIQTLRVLTTLARHVGESPTIISFLVSVAMMNMAANRMEEILQQPNAPSLYYALHDLPHPFLDLRKSLESERLFGHGILPGVKEIVFDPESKPASPRQLKAVFNGNGNLSGFPINVVGRYLTGSAILLKHETAKRALIASGRPSEQVEKMPPLQVALIHAFLEYDWVLDEAISCQSLPYWEVRTKLMAIEKKLGSRKDPLNPPFLTDYIGDRPALPFARLIFPAISNVLKAGARLERQLAAMECLEAIRLHAAANGGELPTKLSEIKIVSVPVDPVTGQAFIYRLDRGKATLASPPFPEGRNEWAYMPVYEVKLRKVQG